MSTTRNKQVSLLVREVACENAWLSNDFERVALAGEACQRLLVE